MKTEKLEVDMRSKLFWNAWIILFYLFITLTFWQFEKLWKYIPRWFQLIMDQASSVSFSLTFFFIHFFDLMAIWEAMKIHTANIPINNWSDIFRLFFINFLFFQLCRRIFKFFNCFLFISLKQEIKISTVRCGEFKPVSSLCRKRLMRLFFVIFGHNQFYKVIWGRLFAIPWKALLILLF